MTETKKSVANTPLGVIKVIRGVHGCIRVIYILHSRLYFDPMLTKYTGVCFDQTP